MSVRMMWVEFRWWLANKIAGDIINRSLDETNKAAYEHGYDAAYVPQEAFQDAFNDGYRAGHHDGHMDAMT